MNTTQDVESLAKIRLQEIHAQMYVLSEEAKTIHSYLSLHEQSKQILSQSIDKTPITELKNDKK